MPRARSTVAAAAAAAAAAVALLALCALTAHASAALSAERARELAPLLDLLPKAPSAADVQQRRAAAAAAGPAALDQLLDALAAATGEPVHALPALTVARTAAAVYAAAAAQAPLEEMLGAAPVALLGMPPSVAAVYGGLTVRQLVAMLTGIEVPHLGDARATPLADVPHVADLVALLRRVLDMRVVDALHEVAPPAAITDLAAALRALATPLRTLIDGELGDGFAYAHLLAVFDMSVVDLLAAHTAVADAAGAERLLGALLDTPVDALLTAALGEHLASLLLQALHQDAAEDIAPLLKLPLGDVLAETLSLSRADLEALGRIKFGELVEARTGFAQADVAAVLDMSIADIVAAASGVSLHGAADALERTVSEVLGVTATELDEIARSETLGDFAASIELELEPLDALLDATLDALAKNATGGLFTLTELLKAPLRASIAKLREALGLDELLAELGALTLSDVGLSNEVLEVARALPEPLQVPFVLSAVTGTVSGLVFGETGDIELFDDSELAARIAELEMQLEQAFA